MTVETAKILLEVVNQVQLNVAAPGFEEKALAIIEARKELLRIIDAAAPKE